MPVGKVSFLDSEKRGVRRAWNYKFRDAERSTLCSLGMCVSSGAVNAEVAPKVRRRSRGRGKRRRGVRGKVG